MMILCFLIIYFFIVNVSFFKCFLPKIVILLYCVSYHFVNIPLCCDLLLRSDYLSVSILVYYFLYYIIYNNIFSMYSHSRYFFITLISLYYVHFNNQHKPFTKLTINNYQTRNLFTFIYFRTVRAKFRKENYIIVFPNG